MMKKKEICAESSENMASSQKLVRSKGSVWADVQPELLANIFRRLPLKQLLSVVPCVCKPWMRASLDPLCWQVLDLRELSFQASNHRLARSLLRRTEGHLQEFVFPYMRHPEWLKVLESSAPMLQKLHIPYSCVSNEWIISVAPLMTHITDLDLSDITGVQNSSAALEAVGKHCRHITHLRWNRDHSWVRMTNHLFKDDSEALAIAQNYPSLKHLELRNNSISTQGVRAILDGCSLLEHLDLTVCVMDMDKFLQRECQTRLRVFLEPLHNVDACEFDDIFNEYDNDDEIDDVGCGWCSFSETGEDYFSELDLLCDCHDFGDIETEYRDEVKDEEDEDEYEGEGGDEDGVEDRDADADHDEGEDELDDDFEVEEKNEEDHVYNGDHADDDYDTGGDDDYDQDADEFDIF